MKKMSEELENNYVEIIGDDGSIEKCEIYDVVDYEEKTYALLLPIDEDNDSDEKEVIVMEYVEEGEDGYFKNIDDENEFQRVCEYIESLDEEEDE